MEAKLPDLIQVWLISGTLVNLEDRHGAMLQQLLRANKHAEASGLSRDYHFYGWWEEEGRAFVYIIVGVVWSGAGCSGRFPISATSWLLCSSGGGSFLVREEASPLGQFYNVLLESSLTAQPSICFFSAPTDSISPLIPWNKLFSTGTIRILFTTTKAPWIQNGT